MIRSFSLNLHHAIAQNCDSVGAFFFLAASSMLARGPSSLLPCLFFGGRLRLRRVLRHNEHAECHSRGACGVHNENLTRYVIFNQRRGGGSSSMRQRRYSSSRQRQRAAVDGAACFLCLYCNQCRFKAHLTNTQRTPFALPSAFLLLLLLLIPPSPTGIPTGAWNCRRGTPFPRRRCSAQNRNRGLPAIYRAPSTQHSAPIPIPRAQCTVHSAQSFLGLDF